MINPKSIVTPVLRSAMFLNQNARNWAETWHWRMFGGRPALNAASATAHIDRLLGESIPPSPLLGESIHVRIAFHYVPRRLKYLFETIEAAAALPFRTVDIWIDTNTADLFPELEGLRHSHSVQVWDDLEHPFLLTWVHRRAMQDRIDDFEAFFYLEDDMICPPRSMQMWLRETPRLSPLGLIPGFVRVEEGPGEELYLSDYIEQVSRDCIREIDGRPYLSTPYPYQACWVYDQPHMRELMATSNYLSGAVEEKDLGLFERDGAPDVRAQVALGLQFTAIPDGYKCRAVVPLTDDLQIAPDALIFHGPSNYANMRPPHPAKLGQLPLTKLFEGPG